MPRDSAAMRCGGRFSDAISSIGLIWLSGAFSPFSDPALLVQPNIECRLQDGFRRTLIPCFSLGHHRRSIQAGELAMTAEHLVRTCSFEERT